MASRALKVWLVSNNNPFPSGQEGRLVHDGIRTRLNGWFGRVARHSKARSGRPAALTGTIDVQWSDLSNTAFLAQHIWNWRPQYVRGQGLTPRRP